MAEVTRNILGTSGLSSVTPTAENVLAGLIAGEDLESGQAAYVASDGRVYLATGAAADEKARVRGFVAKVAYAGEAVTLHRNVRVQYGTDLPAPGTDLYLSGTVAGGLADAASTGGTTPIAYVLDDTRIQIGSLI